MKKNLKKTKPTQKATRQNKNLKSKKKVASLVLALFLLLGVGSMSIISCERKTEKTTIIKEVPNNDEPAGVKVDIHPNGAGVEVKSKE